MINENSRYFILDNISKILFAYEVEAGSLIAAQCPQLVLSIIHNTEDALKLGQPSEWDYEIAKCINECDKEGLEYILKSIYSCEMGKSGGSVKSEAKKKASKENGKKGGRPKKS